jgi:hypothetical protein
VKPKDAALQSSVALVGVVEVEAVEVEVVEVEVVEVEVVEVEVVEVEVETGAVGVEVALPLPLPGAA